MPDALVIDAGAALRVVLASQAGHAEALEAYTRAVRAGWAPIAPDVYLYETGNALARSRTTAGRAERLLDAYELVEVVRPTIASLARALAVAEDGKLTFYDAAYLALAEERDALLWTEDRELLKRFSARTASTAELTRRLS